MNHTATIGTQKKAMLFAFFAVTLFAFYESLLGALTHALSIEFLIGYRIVLTGLLFSAVLQISVRAGLVENIPIQFHPTGIDRIIWSRAAVTIFYLTILSVAFSNAKTQASVYPFFFTHPLWQILACRYIGGKWPDMKNHVWPLTMTIGGVVLFSITTTIHSDGTGLKAFFDCAPVYIPALLAGAGFAYTNECSAHIARTCDKHPYKFLGDKMCTSVSGLRITMQTTYAAFLMLPFAMLVIRYALIAFNIDNMSVIGQKVDTLFSEIGWLSVGCVIVAAGTWLFSEAFARSTSSAPVAAMDCLILPIGMLFDLWSGKASIDDAGFPALAISMLIIFVSSVWLAFADEIAALRSRLVG